jgi:hypothetical protein
MFWVIRWTDAQSGDDKSIVVEGESRSFAELAALKRGIPVAFLGEASPVDIAIAREQKLLWKYTPDPKHTCFGRAVTYRELVCLLVAGLATLMLLLHRQHVALSLF